MLNVRLYTTEIIKKFDQGIKYDDYYVNPYNISELTSDNIPLELIENSPIVGKDWPYISVHTIESDGRVTTNLPNVGGVYAYQLISSPDKLYVGMSINLTNRHASHKNNVKYGLKHSPAFYAAVNKYGWDAFRLCILETVKVDFNKDVNIALDIYNRELFYFNLLKPCYNVNLNTGPGNPGYVWTEEQSLKHSLRQRGVPKKKDSNTSTEPDRTIVRSDEWKINNRAVSIGVSLEVYENDILLKTFDTLKEAGKYYNVQPGTISHYANIKKLFDNKYLFKLIPKYDIFDIDNNSNKSLLLPLDPSITKSINPRGTVIDVFNKDKELIYKFDSVKDACEYMHMSSSTLLKYIKSEECYLGKWYFKQHKRSTST